ncbi:MAG: glutamate racemase [Bacteriovorax sp.]|nr:glutamate racemase [Bacteriovorax sp.]
MPDMINTDKNIQSKKIGLFDSGIGGFSVLGELFKLMPEADYYYVSDDANAPYGPKSDEFITERCNAITKELIAKGVDLIVVACNTATAASIDSLREKFIDISFVGVEPYLKAYYQIPEGLEKKMMVLTTESTGKSERFKRLKERLDPESQIDHYSLKNLARLIENYYYHFDQKNGIDVKFESEFEAELSFLKDHHYAYAILGCTHYPLVRERIEKLLDLKAISPCSHVAQRVVDLLHSPNSSAIDRNIFNFLSTSNNLWIKKNRESLYGPFKGK